MSRDHYERRELLEQLGHEVRANQRATAIVDDATDALLGVNRTDGRCLDLLEQRGQMSAGELARESGLTTGAITAVIDRLERAGYAKRVADPSDRRRVLIEPTAKAREMSRELFEPLIEMVEPYMARYSNADLQMLIDFQREGRELQERHAELLRERLRDRKSAD